jgi:acyl carrier protein
MIVPDIITFVECESGKLVTRETRLDSLGLDSLEFLNLMLLCGVPDEKVAALETVGDICDAVCN